MRKNIFIILICFAYLSASAQKETFNWTFGANSGLTWNTTRSLACTGLAGTPNATLSGLPTFFKSSLITDEGCSTLSDKDGNLLLYTNGIAVWNKNNAGIVGGLTGHTSSVQSSVVLPYPGSTTRYMIISLGDKASGNLSYTIIDMSLNGGLGGVVPSQKNILFPNPTGTTGESSTVVKHANGIDYWVIAPGRTSQAPYYINAWRVSSSGVSSSPVVTSHYYSPPPSPLASNGYFKFTHDAKHFVWATFTSQTVVYGDFNSSTGQFSNMRIMNLPTPYGVEFSASLKYLYLGLLKELRVYDFEALLATSNPATVVPKSFTFEYEPPLGYALGPMGLQMGPDGRIYLSAQYQNYLFFIDNPEEYNNLKIYKLPDGFLSEGKSYAGLLSFSASWFVPRRVMPVNPTLRTKSY